MNNEVTKQGSQGSTESRPTFLPEIAIAFEPFSGRFPALSGVSGGKTVLNRSRVSAGWWRKMRSQAGHNNIEINPVFRGMSFGRLPAILTKGKL
jgi:hypothetical protein